MEQEERNIDRMIEQLRKQYRLSSTEQEIASYVLMHLQTMPAMTVRDQAMRRQAQSCGSSKDRIPELSGFQIPDRSEVERTWLSADEYGNEAGSFSMGRASGEDHSENDRGDR